LVYSEEALVYSGLFMRSKKLWFIHEIYYISEEALVYS